MTPDPEHAKAGAVGDLGDPSLLDAGAVAHALGADAERGLTAQQASRRLAQSGPNKLQATPRRPTWRRILTHFHNPLIYLLLAAVVVALVRYAYSKPWFRGCRVALTDRAGRFFAPQQRLHLRHIKSRLLPLRHPERMRWDIAAAFEEAESVWKTCSSAAPAQRFAWTVPQHCVRRSD